MCWLTQILGFPLETAAVLLLPYFGVKYFIDKDSVSEDISNAVVRAPLWHYLLACVITSSMSGVLKQCLYFCLITVPKSSVHLWSAEPGDQGAAGPGKVKAKAELATAALTVLHN